MLAIFLPTNRGRFHKLDRNLNFKRKYTGSAEGVILLYKFKYLRQDFFF